MQKQAAIELVKNTFSRKFDEENFVRFIANVLKTYDQVVKIREGHYIREAYRGFVDHYTVIGHFKDAANNQIDVLHVTLLRSTSLDRARTAQRNFVADYLKNQGKEAALVAFIAPGEADWRFSLVRLDHSLEVNDGKVKTIEELTPARRWSFLVGEHEGSHTVQSRFVTLLTDSEPPNLRELENAFNIEVVTEEFFSKYVELFHRVRESLEALIKADPDIAEDFREKDISPVDFAKKTLGQMAFLYFLQKKGWFGVAPKAEWGTGRKNFLRELFERRQSYGKNFFDDILEPLFYEALAQDRGKEAIYPRLNNCRMPFLNGGLFEPMRGYSWETTHILLDDAIFSNTNKTKEGDVGDGILDVFDRYNFTVNENEPLEKEVAVDPEMLGKVFENLLEIKDRKSKGTFYTPREIVHYMCQQSLVNFLSNNLEEKVPIEDLEVLIQRGSQILQNDSLVIEKGKEGTYKFLTPETVRRNALDLDRALETIKVCDPAVGSGAFPLGMLTEIVQARQVLAVHLNNNASVYELKLHSISNSIHGVDIDPGAVEIAKLRLWLALVVEEDEPHPLPNLEHKIMQGNSLISDYEGIRLFDESLLEKDQEKMVQLGMNFGSDSEQKLDRLKIVTEQFIHESQKSKKQDLKDEIGSLKWELIDATLKEQKKTEKLNEIRKLRQKNTRPFFVWRLEFSDVFRERGGFDIVIANPPYVGEKGNKDIFRSIAKGNLGQFYHGKMDLFYFFFHLALDLGNENSQHAFITTNYYITATGAKGLRIHLKENSTIRTLIDFNELRIFESALGQHNLITIFSKSKEPQSLALSLVAKVGGVANESILKEILHNHKADMTEIFVLSQNQIYEGKENYIRLKGVGNYDNPAQSIADKLKKDATSLGVICNINQGIVSGADRFTTKHAEKYQICAEKGEGIFVLSKDEIDALTLNDFEKNMIHPFYKNSQISRYCIEKNKNLFIIYIDKNTDINKAPNIIKHLGKFKKILENKRECKSGSLPWYSLHWSREQSMFDECKIVNSRRSKRNNFALEVDGRYEQSDIMLSSIRNEYKKKVSIKYLISLLNSKTYYFWLFNKGKRKGNMLELFYQPLSEIPIKCISLEEQKPFIELVDKILAITSKLEYCSKHPPALQLELEMKIDELVFDLYGLTAEERAVVINSQADAAII